MKKITSVIVLISIFLSSIQTSFAEVNIESNSENVVQAETSSEEGGDLLEEMNDLQYEIVDPYFDKYEHGDGRVSARLYSAPRSLVFDELTQSYQQLPEGFSYFSSYNEGRSNSLYGYKYYIGNGKDLRLDEFSIESGVMSFGDIEQWPLSSEQESVDEGIIYRDVYPGIDIEFKDSNFAREKFIHIKEKPTYLNYGDDLIFSEIIEIPKGAKVMIGDPNIGEEVENETEQEIGSQPFYVVMDDGSFLRYGNSYVYDSKAEGINDIDQQSVSVTQRLIMGSDASDELIVQQIIGWDYLMDEQREYPVIVDPALHYCKESVVYEDNQYISSGCNMEDFYSRSEGGYVDNTSALFMGKSSSLYRVPVFKFNNITNYVPQGSTINGAWLNAFYRNEGTGTFDKDTNISFTARMIDTSWGSRNLDYLLANTSQNGGTTGISDNPGQEYTWYIKSIVDSWVSTPSSNYGLLLSQTGDKTTWKNRFHSLYSSRYSDPAKRPFLSISYTEPVAPDPDIEIVYIEQVTPKLKFNEPFQVRVWVKRDEPINSDYKVRVNLGEDYNDSGPPSETRTVYASDPSTRILLFTLTPSVFYAPMDYIRVEVDSDDDISESDESNNIEIQEITQPPSDPDLIVSSLSVDDYIVNAGGRTRVNATILNQGGPSVSSSVEYYLNSVDSLTGATYINSDSFGALNSDESVEESDPFYIPSNTPPGNYFVIAHVDPENDVDEDNELNNTSSIQIEVKPNVPQLRIDSFVYVNNLVDPVEDTPFSVGDEIEVVTYMVQNNGSIDAVGVTYNLILVENATGIEYGLTDITPVSFDVDAGVSINLSASGKVPASIDRGGSYRIRVIVDHANNYDEADETDNSKDSVNNFYIENPTQTSYIVGGNYVGGDIDTYTNSLDLKSNVIAQDPVNFRNGQFYLNSTDFVLDGRGHDINFSKTYNSRNASENLRMGNGWSHSYNSYLHENEDGSINLFKGGALASKMTSSDGVNYYSQGSQDKLIKVVSGYEYHLFGGDIFYFDESTKVEDNLYMISWSEDLNGNRSEFTYLDREGIKLLSEVKDASGRVLEIVYGDENDPALWDKIINIHTNIPGEHSIQVDYEYTVQGDLTLLTKSTEHRSYKNESVEQLIREYVYDENGYLVEYTDPRGTKVFNEYDTEGKTVRQFYFDPSIHTEGQKDIVYDYAYEQSLASVPGCLCTVSNSYASDTEVELLTMCFDNQGQKIAEINGNDSVTRYEYDSRGLVSKIIAPNGSVKLNSYNQDMQLTSETYPEVDGRTLVKTYTYNNLNKPLTVTETETDLNNSTTVRLTTNEYDTQGNLVKQIDPLGGEILYEYDQYGNTTKVIDERGNATEMTYDSNSNYLATLKQAYTNINQDNKESSRSFEYDNFGNVVLVTDPLGNSKQNSYDSHGNLREVIDYNTAKTTYEYDLEHNLVKEISPYGYVTLYENQTDLHEKLKLKSIGPSLTSSISPSVIENTYDRLGRVIQTTDPNGNTTLFKYNNKGLLIEKITPENKVFKYEYDLNGNLTREEVLGGLVVEYEYNSINLPTKVRTYKNTSDYLETTTKYDSYGNVLESIASNGGVTSYQYDKKNRLLSKTDALNKTTSYSYDLVGNLIGITTPNAQNNANYLNEDGYSVSYQYDELNQKIIEKDALNQINAYKYDEAGNLVKYMPKTNSDFSKDDRAMTFEYDKVGNQTKIIYPDGTSVKKHFDLQSRLSFQINQSGKYDFITGYNHLDKITFILDDARNYQQLNIYDLNGNLKTRVLPGKNSGRYYQFFYDKDNKLIREKDPKSNNTFYEYDNNNYLSKTTLPKGNEVIYSYDNIGNLLTEVDESGAQTVYEYNDLNQLTKITQGQVETIFEYDLLGRLVTQIDPTNDTTGQEKYIFTYDSEDNLIDIDDPLNSSQDSLALSYDKLNRLTSKVASDVNQSFVYNEYNNLVSSTNDNFSIDYTYNNLGQVINESHNFGTSNLTKNVSMEYNPSGQLELITYPSGEEVRYEYDQNSLMSEVSLNNTPLVNYNYIKGSLLETETYANNTVKDYTYDQNAMVASMTLSSSTNSFTPKTISYTYDQNQNTVQIDKPSGSIINQYDQQDQLVESTSGGQTYSYSYSLYGDRQNMTLDDGSTQEASSYVYNAETQQLLSLQVQNNANTNSFSFNYDKLGHLAQKVRNDGVSIVSTDYIHNRLGYLQQIQTQVEDIQSGNIENSNVTYQYDNSGNRVSKTKAGQTVYYVNSGLDVLGEYDSQGNTLKERIYGLGGAIAELDETGNILYLNDDNQGTLVASIDETGNISKEYEYGPFGEINEGNFLNPTTKTTETNYQYTGQEFDAESGLQYYNARYYDSEIGRFIQRDSYLGEVGDNLTRNRYAYVKNNPYKYVDPSGRYGLKYVSEQAGNIGSWWMGNLEYTGGLIKGTYAGWTGNEELLKEANESISAGYNKSSSAVIEMGNTWNEYAEKSWSERLSEDLSFAEDIISVAIDEGLGVEQTAPGVIYYKDVYNKLDGSVITEFEEQSLDYGDAEVIGVMIGLISPGGKDKKAKKIYGAVSDTIEDAYKKNKGKIEDVVEFGKNTIQQSIKNNKLIETKEFGYLHGQKVYKRKNLYYSKDIDSHAGGIWKVFRNTGGKLERIGTADEDLNIFKK